MYYIPDSNTFSAIVRRVSPILHRYEQLIQTDADFIICPVVYYEVSRGLKKLNATRQLNFLQRTTTLFDWQELEREDWEQAATLWSTLEKDGLPIGDMDILIAVFAVRRSGVVVTSNRRHFNILASYIPLQHENWFA